MKKALVTLGLASALLLTGQSAFAATALCFYDTCSTYSSNFSNSDGTVVLNGWQTSDTPAQFPPKITYSVVTYHVFGSDEVWAISPLTGDYPKAGNWYSIILSNIPNRTDLCVKTVINAGYNTIGAGNAY